MDNDFLNNWRMELGLGNPNKAATLIAMLMIAVWGLAYVRRWGFWVGLMLFCGLAIALLHTSSRGGLVAMLAGSICLLCFSSRPWRPRCKLAVVIVTMGLMLYSAQTNAAHRYVKGIAASDLSISNRLLIWKQVPRMMLDAPGGWGIGNSGNAYMQWYQPIGRFESYRTLVNSHFTWLVEFGWLGRIAYLFGWSVVFLICWPTAKNRWFCVPLGIWTAFAAGAFFSSVAESLWLWIIPLAALLTVAVVRVLQWQWPSMRSFGCTYACIGALFMGFLATGSLTGQGAKIWGGKDAVRIGSEKPATWVVALDSKITGDHYGQSVRNAGIPLGIAKSFNDVPPTTCKELVLMGNCPINNKALSVSSIVLLNPIGHPEGMAPKLASDQAGRVLWGEFRQDGNRAEWESWTNAHSRMAFKQAEGDADYLPDWLALVSGGNVQADWRNPSLTEK